MKTLGCSALDGHCPRLEEVIELNLLLKASKPCDSRNPAVRTCHQPLCSACREDPAHPAQDPSAPAHGSKIRRPPGRLPGQPPPTCRGAVMLMKAPQFNELLTRVVLVPLWGAGSNLHLSVFISRNNQQPEAGVGKDPLAARG